ncbi:hypothetical protein HDZ31DRAFT_61959 [Schizophyllum fasciatum]
MTPTIKSSSFSMLCDMETLPTVNYRLVDIDSGQYRRQIEHFEYHWGLRKGELDLSTPLNHIELRDDMVQSLRDGLWTLMPTKQTLDAILKLAECNSAAENVTARKAFTELLPEMEYEYEFVPLTIKEEDRPVIYVSEGSKTRAVRAPYSRMPRIKARAHPLFVVFHADTPLALYDSSPRSKVARLEMIVTDIMDYWLTRPPLTFVVGPDVWKQHRHPLSDDGSCARMGLKTVRPASSRHQQQAIRKTTKAPCPQAKLWLSRTSQYDRRRRPKAIVTRAALSGRSDATDEDIGYGPREVHHWLDRVRREASSGEDKLTDLDIDVPHEYRHEIARDPANALCLTTRMRVGGLVTGGLYTKDHSHYSSNDWARAVYYNCLWSSKPPKDAH